MSEFDNGFARAQREYENRMPPESDPLPHVIAAFDGFCPWCELDIDEGDAIVLMRWEDEWVHRECAEDEGYEVV